MDHIYIHTTTSDHHITPGEILRKLSHSKIIVHMPHILCDKGGGNEKDGVVELIPIEEPEPEVDDEEEEDDRPPEIKIKTIVEPKWKLMKGLPCGKYLGLIFALISSVLISLMTLIVKSMSEYHPLSLVIWRLQGVLFPAIVIMSYFKKGRGVNIFEPVWPLTSRGKWGILLMLVARGVFGCSSDIFQYYSLKYLSLADSAVIAYSSPIFVTFVAYFVLGEKCGIVSIFTGILSLLGVLIISRPPMLTGEENFDSNVLIGNGLALGCMIMATFTYIILRILRNIHFSLSNFSFGFFGTIESLIMCWILSTFSFPQGTHDWILAGTIALLNFLGQLFFTLALQFEDAGPVSLVRSCDVIFAYIWQFLFLNVVPDVFSLIGGSVVIVAVFITGIRKWLKELPVNDKKRERFRILLR